jgi:hypothetical protein
MNMKTIWIAAMTAGLLAVSAVAQTSADGSASANASVTPAKSSAGTGASHGTLTPGAAASVDASANAQTSYPSDGKKKEKDSGSAASASASGLNGGSAALSSGTTLEAELTKSIDAKKAKPGDEVTAKLMQDVKSDGKVVIHKGSKLVGHVTEAQAKSKENAESKLGVVFDKAVLKGGQEVAFSSVIQALAPPVQGALSVAGDEASNLGSGMGNGSPMGGGRSAGGMAPMGGSGNAPNPTLGSTPGNTAGPATNSATGAVNGSANQTAGAAANGTLTSASHGVIGMQGVALSTAAAGSAQGSMISSASRNIKLDGGTQMILQVTSPAPAQ